MNIQQFQYVLAVVDLKNFEAAAEKCFVTQSTLSTMIGRFEDEMEIKIFNRKTKPVSITAEGEELIKRLRIILNEIDSLKNLVQELKGEMVGELKIGIIPTIAPYLLPLFLTNFASVFPKVKMIIKEMTTSEIQKSLKIRTIDVGVLALPLEDDDLNEFNLYSEPFLLYDCSDEILNTKVSINKLDYSKLCLLQKGHCLRTQVQRICDLSNKFSKTDVNFEFESGSMDSLLRITEARKGMTILPYLASINLTDETAKKIVEFESPVPVRQVGLITYKFFVKKKLLNKLIEVIQNSVSDYIPKTDDYRVLKPI
ncbi:LysR family hydrogen peroxide-inducible transcriptional activator [Tenacibaculum adriaticum]|uniref:LysR family hydrogen peroxide-inducible transcriptional activator n=1 Tax=Tenacibaculum adriaticum TaxID=413713 RepID=A0A5S5DR30_9FLAO|nr:hydrogen peroxide-inducible genes activator [Tenacibaculum adriaticum]TYP97322.1 LysR family hydrogen peroxide-inducible transcriptional activator [Tenacibaculum adriaticum]